MKARGVSLVHSEAEVTWVLHRVHLNRLQKVIGGVDHEQGFHHATAHLVSV